jgi:chemotaxis regulatin CheY-phosphate phosphatase CheZ
MTTKTRDLAVVMQQVTQNLCSTSSRALPEEWRKTQANELSLYQGSLSDRGVAKNIRKLQSAFPKQSKEFFNVLAERLIANGFTDDRLTDAVNNVIDNFKFKELNIADIVHFDKKMKLYTYKEACKLVTEGGYEFGKDLQRISVDDKVFWTLKI